MDWSKKPIKARDGRIIIHFDYDCFYASVFEAENPALKSLPLAVQQKQIIVTCNYEARRRGLYKLQLIRAARKVCPDAIIVLGEDLTRFRDVSKALYQFLREFSWNKKVERLGFDEVWMDVTDMVDYNIELLNVNDLSSSFFHLSRSDPTLGFSYDASCIAGHTYPPSLSKPITPPISAPASPARDDNLLLRLRLGSHLAQHVRHQLEEQRGYTSTVGISTSKLLSKLVGSVNKPKGQTTLIPPYEAIGGTGSNVTTFVDDYEIGKIPYIGFKLAQKLREHVLQRPAVLDTALLPGSTKEIITVGHVRVHEAMGPELLEKLLGGPGSPRGIGAKVWDLLNGVDDTEVGQARDVPRQISIEDSYTRLDTLEEVLKELSLLGRSLIRRMHADLLESDENQATSTCVEPSDLADHDMAYISRKRWVAHPRTLRLSTRLRPSDGTRSRAYNRISRSSPMPNFIFNLSEHVEALAGKLVTEVLLPMFRKLHPAKSGWNLSLLNIAVTNMADVGSETKSASGRDIGRMFLRQEDVLREWRVEDQDGPTDDQHDICEVQHDNSRENTSHGVLQTPSHRAQNAQGKQAACVTRQAQGSEDSLRSSPDGLIKFTNWEHEDDTGDLGMTCDVCGAVVPDFAMLAHERFHTLGD